MSDTVVLKTVEDRIRDLINPDLEHDYEKEIIEILEMIELEKVANEEWWRSWGETLERGSDRLRTILDCVADYIMLKGIR